MLQALISLIVWIAAWLIAPTASLCAEQEYPERLGFHIFAHSQRPSVHPDALVILYEGPIEYPMAENLAEIWSELRGRQKSIVLELDSSGGSMSHAEKVIEVLKQIRHEAKLTTLVTENHKCLSACVLVYLQGEQRIAGNATAWMFHGPRRAYTNVPSSNSTRRYVELLREGGVSESFISFLSAHNRLYLPGGFWMSGHELFQMHHSNIITRLLEPWQPEAPMTLPYDPELRSR